MKQLTCEVTHKTIHLQSLADTLEWHIR